MFGDEFKCDVCGKTEQLGSAAIFTLPSLPDAKFDFDGRSKWMWKDGRRYCWEDACANFPEVAEATKSNFVRRGAWMS